QVDDIHAGLIDVVEVAVRHVALADAPGNVMHHRRVLDEGPRQRPHQEHGDEHAEPGDDGDAAERARAHQIVLGKRYRCWSRPSTPRGISSTTAMMIAPNSSGWTYGYRAHTISWATNSTTAPITGPNTVPLPPNSAITIIVTVMASGNTLIGSM